MNPECAECRGECPECNEVDVYEVLLLSIPIAICFEEDIAHAVADEYDLGWVRCLD